MKSLIIIAAFTLSASAFAGQTHVHGYVKKDGTVVEPHERSTPNDRKYDNNNSKTNGGTESDEFHPSESEK